MKRKANHIKNGSPRQDLTNSGASATRPFRRLQKFEMKENQILKEKKSSNQPKLTTKSIMFKKMDPRPKEQIFDSEVDRVVQLIENSENQAPSRGVSKKNMIRATLRNLHSQGHKRVTNTLNWRLRSISSQKPRGMSFTVKKEMALSHKDFLRSSKDQKNRPLLKKKLKRNTYKPLLRLWNNANEKRKKSKRGKRNTINKENHEKAVTSTQHEKIEECLISKQVRPIDSNSSFASLLHPMDFHQKQNLETRAKSRYLGISSERAAREHNKNDTSIVNKKKEPLDAFLQSINYKNSTSFNGYKKLRRVLGHQQGSKDKSSKVLKRSESVNDINLSPTKKKGIRRDEESFSIRPQLAGNRDQTTNIVVKAISRSRFKSKNGARFSYKERKEALSGHTLSFKTVIPKPSENQLRMKFGFSLNKKQKLNGKKSVVDIYECLYTHQMPKPQRISISQQNNRLFKKKASAGTTPQNELENPRETSQRKIRRWIKLTQLNSFNKAARFRSNNTDLKVGGLDNEILRISSFAHNQKRRDLRKRRKSLRAPISMNLQQKIKMKKELDRIADQLNLKSQAVLASRPCKRMKAEDDTYNPSSYKTNKDKILMSFGGGIPCDCPCPEPTVDTNDKIANNYNEKAKIKPFVGKLFFDEKRGEIVEEEMERLGLLSIDIGPLMRMRGFDGELLEYGVKLRRVGFEGELVRPVEPEIEKSDGGCEEMSGKEEKEGKGRE